MIRTRIKLHSGIAAVSANPFDCVRVNAARINVQIPKYRGPEVDKMNLMRDWQNVGEDIKKSIIKIGNERNVK